ncbi:hypothetical protein GNF18_08210 [Ligilactobacillus pobuzihii]|uniref:hypothetical protein n=1 Tax=Ligilactobacillus pobuzihii TaxID=449659 RepID=UPI0019D246BB|nr:hypothetical protein [Ligilactobacillus pobuzihii]MBN7275119.1 hypothetical protein [Ligilactobacillus pobuzihii]HIZ96367.1 hypothetical protein [Candidatus Ligilactobacillus excrementavium]
MDLAISILLIVLAVIVSVLGTYLFLHRNRSFLIFHPEQHRGLRLFCTFFGIFMLFCAVLTVSVIFFDPTWLLVTVIFLDVLSTFTVPFVLWGYTL